MSDDDAYRNSAAWQRLQDAVSELVLLDPDLAGHMPAEVVVSVYSVPMGESEITGAYSHFATAAIPHHNEGLHSKGAEWWACYGEG